MNHNHITVVGNATRDPELRFTTGGTAVAGFGLAVNRSWKNKTTDEWEEETSFFNVVCWGDLGENVAASIVKGSRVFVSGRLDQREWEDREGEKRMSVEINAEACGPDLRWAQAKIERNERSGSGPAPSRPAEKVYGDEEPF
jgi:single-strand DNA-binding protein